MTRDFPREKKKGWMVGWFVTVKACMAELYRGSDSQGFLIAQPCWSGSFFVPCRPFVQAFNSVGEATPIGSTLYLDALRKVMLAVNGHRKLHWHFGHCNGEYWEPNSKGNFGYNVLKIVSWVTNLGWKGCLVDAWLHAFHETTSSSCQELNSNFKQLHCHKTVQYMLRNLYPLLL